MSYINLVFPRSVVTRMARLASSSPKCTGLSLCLTLSAILLAAAAIFRLESPPKSAAAQSLFFDGFETGDFSQWTSVTITGNGTAEVQTALVRTGTYSARLSSSANADARANIRKTMQPEQTDIRTDGAFNIQSEGAAGGNVPLIRVFAGGGNRLVS